MLRKPVILLLMSLYLVTASGFSLNLHYCMGRLKSLRIDAPARECVTAQQTKKLKCCRDQHLVVKVKDTHLGSSALVLAKLFAFALPPISFPALTLKIEGIELTCLAYRGPPPFPDNPLYLQNQNFRI